VGEQTKKQIWDLFALGGDDDGEPVFPGGLVRVDGVEKGEQGPAAREGQGGKSLGLFEAVRAEDLPETFEMCGLEKDTAAVEVFKGVKAGAAVKEGVLGGKVEQIVKTKNQYNPSKKFHRLPAKTGGALFVFEGKFEYFALLPGGAGLQGLRGHSKGGVAQKLAQLLGWTGETTCPGLGQQAQGPLDHT